MRETSLQCIYELAKQDNRIVFIGSDLGPNTLKNFQKEMPDRFFMEGISEQHVISMSAGLAMEGYIPFVNTIATFLTRRCFEQIVVDLCLHNLPVRLLGFGGGVVYAPLGPTHLAVEDFAILRAIPNMTILAPCDANEIKQLIPQTAQWDKPIYIRLAKGDDTIVSSANTKYSIGKAILMREPENILFISTGVMTQRALEAANILMKSGISAGVLHVHTIKPIDKEAILSLAKKVKLIITIEEHTRIGGLGSAVLETVMDEAEYLDFLPNVIRLGLPDEFVDGYGTQDFLLSKYKLDTDHIVKTAIKYSHSI